MSTEPVTPGGSDGRTPLERLLDDHHIDEASPLTPAEQLLTGSAPRKGKPS